MMYETLTKIRELVDELYDNTQPHSSTNSMLFLEINQAIDEAQRYVRKSEAGSVYGKQVDEVVKENRRIY